MTAGLESPETPKIYYWVVIDSKWTPVSLRTSLTSTGLWCGLKNPEVWQKEKPGGKPGLIWADSKVKRKRQFPLELLIPTFSTVYLDSDLLPVILDTVTDFTYKPNSLKKKHSLCFHLKKQFCWVCVFAGRWLMIIMGNCKCKVK